MEPLNSVLEGPAEHVLAELPEACIDLVVTSPPYDDLRAYDGYRFPFEAIAEQLQRVLKPGGVIVWVVGDATINGSETGSSFRQALYFNEIGLRLHDTMIYQKSNCAFPSQNRYYQIFEYMFILSKGKPKTFQPIRDRENIYVGQKPHGKSRTKKGWSRNGSRCVTGKYGVRYNIWRYVTGGGNVTSDRMAYDHPAIFPEKLAEDHILSWSAPGDVVLDPLCGSGTTLKMAARHDRNYIGIDVSPQYCELSRQRVALAFTST